MKYLVETSGPFMLIDISVEAEIQADRPTIVAPTSFLMAAASRGQLRILRNDLPDEADDVEFSAFWSADTDLAVEAYLSKFSPEAEDDPLEDSTPPAVAPKPARKTRQKKA